MIQTNTGLSFPKERERERERDREQQASVFFTCDLEEYKKLGIHLFCNAFIHACRDATAFILEEKEANVKRVLSFFQLVGWEAHRVCIYSICQGDVTQFK